MRHRPVKSLDAKIAALSHLILKHEAGAHSARQHTPSARQGVRHSVTPDDVPCNPFAPPATPSHPGRWYEREAPRYIIPDEFAGAPIYVEFGCGKGDFINAISQFTSAKKAGALMIGIEGGGSIVLAALRKTEEASISNVRYINNYVNDATKAFAPESLDGIFLNFSDPWPKDRHADRRLTSPSKAAAYYEVIKPGGFAMIKTDGKALFEYSLKTFSAAGFSIQYQTTNLKQAEERSALPPFKDAGIQDAGTNPLFCINEMALAGVFTQTEYEKRFRGMGYPIYCFITTKS